MRIELRDQSRRRIGRIVVDPVQRTTRAILQDRKAMRRGESAPTQNNGAAPREVFLNWDTAVDDAGQLRRCLACGCVDLFREKAFPQVTAFVVVLAFLGAVIGTLGLATNLPVLLTMAGVLVLDIGILVFSRRRLVCYSCRTTYHELPIARYHRPWDRSRADRYPLRAAAVPSGAPAETAASAASSKVEAVLRAAAPTAAETPAVASSKRKSHVA